MTGDYKKAIVEQLDSIHFYRFKDVCVGTALETSLLSKDEKKFFRYLARLFRELLLKRYKALIKRDRGILLFYDYTNMNRKDYIAFFASIDSLMKGCNYVGPEKRLKIQLPRFHIIIKWLLEMKPLDISLSYKLYIMSLMYHSLCAVECIGKHKKNNTAIVVLCDIHYTSSFVVQYFNKCVDTLSLQHGNYSSKSNNVVFRNSRSKYLLAYGEHTKKEAIASGIDINKIKVVGMPLLINKQCCDTYRHIRPYRRCGLIFDGDQYDVIDLKMLAISVKFARENNIELFVKLHPGYGIENYSIDMNSYGNVMFFKDEISSVEFISMVDCIIGNNSTVIIEALLELKDIYIFRDEKYDFYDNEGWCEFSDYTGIERVYSLYADENASKQMLFNRREYYTLTENVANNYFLALKQYV